MAESRAYLDHNASTPLRPAAAEAMARVLQMVGNPSSIHAEGRAARAVLEQARREVASSVGAEARNVVFTSGATEALNMLLQPATADDRLFVLATEHSAALAGGGFPAGGVSRIPVDARGVIDLEWLEAALRGADSGRKVIAAQVANSETGVIQPIREISDIAKRYGAFLVCDAVAAIGKIEVSLPTLGVDAIVLSAHKFGGPKGVGAAVHQNGGIVLPEPLLKGGGQEMRRRSGTENLAGIAAMGVAAVEASQAAGAAGPRLQALRDQLEAELLRLRPDAVVFGRGAPRLPNTLNIGLQGLKSETAVIAFDLAGVSLSSGSACSSGKVQRSHVLDAMGAPPELAEGALRLSLGWTTMDRDISHAVSAFARIAGSHAARAA